MQIRFHMHIFQVYSEIQNKIELSSKYQGIISSFVEYLA